MLTDPMSQQVEALRASSNKDYFAYLMEQGTGKTWTVLAEFERLYAAGLVDSLFIAAPSGVHSNWIMDEMPAHWGDSIPWVGVHWRSGAGKREADKREKMLLQPRAVREQPFARAFAINFEGLLTKPGMNLTLRFLSSTRPYIVIDESQKIRNPKSKRCRAMMDLKSLAIIRRIASGTPLTRGPENVFSQFEWLKGGLLGTSNYRAFFAEYTDLYEEDHPMMRSMIKENPRMQWAQIPKKNPVTGEVMYKNLDKLAGLIAPHSFRKLKKDCLDLPDKVFQTRRFDMTPRQKRLYREMEAEYRLIESERGEVSTQKLVALGKLQQISSGFYNHHERDGGGVEELVEDKKNPRLQLLRSELEDADGSVIIWARFHQEIDSICRLLNEMNFSYLEYHGRIGDKKKLANKQAFQKGKARVMVANAASAGLGITWTIAETAVYYSNELDYELRAQSEDRNHRIGTTNARYIDLVGNDTKDVAIAKGYQVKKQIAEIVLGDN